MRKDHHAIDPRSKLLQHAKHRAKVQGVPFNLTKEDIPVPDRCPVLGIPLAVNRGKRGPTDNSPTIDRIIPNLGYVPGNVIVMSFRANRIKNDASALELRVIADWLDAHILAGNVCPNLSTNA